MKTKQRLTNLPLGFAMLMPTVTPAPSRFDELANLPFGLRQQGFLRRFSSASVLAVPARVTELIESHLKTLAQYPSKQGGTSFDMSNIVQEFLKAKQ